MFVVIIKQQDENPSEKRSHKKCEVEILLQLRDEQEESHINSLVKIPGDHNHLPELRKKKAVGEHVQNVINTGGGGIPAFKAKRLVSVKSPPTTGDKGQDMRLYIMPIFTKQDLDGIVRYQNVTKQCEFLPLHKALGEVGAQPSKYSPETKTVMEAANRWYKKNSSKPGFMNMLFRPSPLERISDNVTNPAYAGEQSKGWFLLENKLTAEEVMDKMKDANKIDLHIENPMFGIDTNPYNKVDMLVINPFFNQTQPRYHDIKVPAIDEWFQGNESSDDMLELSWVDEFPVHRAAADGDNSTLQQLLQMDSRRAETWDHDGWAPVHYACWYGRLETVRLLLDEWHCDPNLCNKNKTSLLHLAAGCGHSQIVKLLCEHQFIDRHMKDKQNRTALECCEQIRSKDWSKCVQHLKDLNHKPYQKVVIHKMDGSEKLLELKCGSNTCVSDVLDSLQLSTDARQYFALWITSNSLHLQLKPEHSLLAEIQKWPDILLQLGGALKESYLLEKPKIVLKRDVKLLPNIEENVTDINSIRLLYEEARAQVLRGLYPCLDEVALAMASIVLRILFGPFDSKKHKPSYFTEEVTSQIIQMSILRNRPIGWVNKILAQYKEISEQGPGEISQLQLLYLRYCWTQIPAYGSAFFTGYAYATRFVSGERVQRIVPLYIGTNHRGIHFIKVEKKSLLVSLSYHSLTWELNEEKKTFSNSNR